MGSLRADIRLARAKPGARRALHLVAGPLLTPSAKLSRGQRPQSGSALWRRRSKATDGGRKRSNRTDAMTGVGGHRAGSPDGLPSQGPAVRMGCETSRSAAHRVPLVEDLDVEDAPTEEIVRIAEHVQIVQDRPGATQPGTQASGRRMEHMFERVRRGSDGHFACRSVDVRTSRRGPARRGGGRPARRRGRRFVERSRVRGPRREIRSYGHHRPSSISVRGPIAAGSR